MRFLVLIVFMIILCQPAEARQKRVLDLDTGQTVVLSLTAAEEAQRDLDEANAAAEKIKKDKDKQDRDTLLSGLNLTEEEWELLKRSDL